MPAGYWFVQRYRVAGEIEAEQPCTDCEEVIAKVETFRNANADSNLKLRVHVPSFATDEERGRIGDLGVEPI